MFAAFLFVAIRLTQVPKEARIDFGPQFEGTQFTMVGSRGVWSRCLLSQEGEQVNVGALPSPFCPVWEPREGMMLSTFRIGHLCR